MFDRFLIHCNAQRNHIISTKHKTRDEVWSVVSKYEEPYLLNKKKRLLTRKQQSRAKLLLLIVFLNLILLFSSVDLKAMNSAGTSIKFS